VHLSQEHNSKITAKMPFSVPAMPSVARDVD